MKPTTITTLPLVLLILSLASLSSCKKDKDESVAITIQTISGAYKLVALTTQINNMPEEDGMQNMEDCQKDDIINFRTDKTYTYTDAGLQCAVPGNDSGNWDLPNTTTFVLAGVSWVLEAFDGRTLKISNTSSFGGDTEVHRVTLRKQ